MAKDKNIMRVYLTREHDALYLLSVYVSATDDSIYFTLPIGDKEKNITNAKVTYHVSGQIHQVSHVPLAASIDDNLKRSIVNVSPTGPRMGFNKDKVYGSKTMSTPLDEITDNPVYAGYTMGIRDSKTIQHSTLRFVDLTAIQKGSFTVSADHYPHLELSAYLVPERHMQEMGGVEKGLAVFGDDQYPCAYSKHPSLPLYIMVVAQSIA